MLVIGGRLVFFYPVLREDDVADVTKFPEHPCFKLVSSCEQILSLRYSRVLLTMVKVGPYTEEVERMGEERHQEFRENHQKWMERATCTLPCSARRSMMGSPNLIKIPSRSTEASTCSDENTGMTILLPFSKGCYVACARFTSQRQLVLGAV